MVTAMAGTSGQGRNATPSVVVGAALFLVLGYFLFPVVLARTFLLVYGKDSPPDWVSSGLEITFRPVRYIYQRVPAYKRLLDFESKMLQMD